MEIQRTFNHTMKHTLQSGYRFDEKLFSKLDRFLLRHYVNYPCVYVSFNN